LSIDTITKKALHAMQVGNYRKAMKWVVEAQKIANPLPVALYEVSAQASLALGDLSTATNSIKGAINVGGATLQRVMFYGDLLLRSGQLQVAADVFQQVIREQDAYPLAWKGLAHCLFQAGDWGRAQAAYAAVLERDPNDIEAKTFIANCILKTDAAAKAGVLLEEVVRDNPDYPQAGVWYGEALRRSGRVEDAIPLFQQWSSNEEVGELAKRLLLASWISIEDYSEVESVLEPLLERYPHDPELLTLHARWLAVEGRREEAIGTLKSILEREPNYFTAWSPLLDAIKEPLDAAFEKRLFSACEQAEKTADKRDTAGMYFAAARQYQLAGDLQKEMHALEKGNATMAELAPMDSTRHAANVKRVREAYPAKKIAEVGVAHNEDSSGFSPVFILSLPRSGSTLLEQALSRHTMAAGAGEANFASDAWRQLTGSWSLTDCPENHESISTEQLEQFRVAYLQAVSRSGIDPNKVMIHKGINNHKIAGLLAAAFPKARFIELNRAPLDVAYGCYKQNFEFQHFSFTVGGIASEISLYRDDMNWWHQVLSGRLNVTTYERLVENFEEELRRLLVWLELPWDDACLDFGRVSRVGTASMNQVREGVFTTAVGKYDKYGELFSPFVKALEQKGVNVRSSLELGLHP